MRTKLLMFVAVALWMGSHLAQAAGEQVSVTGIFSDLYYNDEGGDLLGTEIFIVLDGTDKYVAFFQYWAGGGDPAIVVPVTVGGSDNYVLFEVPEPALGAGIYEGHITKTGFRGVWKHRLSDGQFSKEPIRLKRKKSYWQ